MRLPLALAGFLLAAAPVASCDLALVLAVDVSGSVDEQEFDIQMDGLAIALRDGVVSEALVRADAQVMLVQWTGATRQRVTIPWTAMDTFVAVETFAAAVSEDQRVWRNYSTAIGEALEYALSFFEEVPQCRRRVIDLSGDGSSNEGVAPDRIHRALRSAGVVVNAIAIEESEPDLTAYYFENVLVGEGAFVETAATFEEYPAKIRRKLLREITKQTARAGPESPRSVAFAHVEPAR